MFEMRIQHAKGMSLQKSGHSRDAANPPLVGRVGRRFLWGAYRVRVTMEAGGRVSWRLPLESLAPLKGAGLTLSGLVKSL